MRVKIAPGAVMVQMSGGNKDVRFYTVNRTITATLIAVYGDVSEVRWNGSLWTVDSVYVSKA